MDAATVVSVGKIGGAAALGLSSIGSTMGAGTASMAAIGAWKKCYAQNKMAPFLLVAFIGAPLSQTIYGMITMNKIVDAAVAGAAWPALLGAGVFGGLGIGASAWLQGMAGAAGSDALAETGKGFGNYLMALGVIETVAIFVMIFVAKVIA